jgi:hypothetical protein
MDTRHCAIAPVVTKQSVVLTFCFQICAVDFDIIRIEVARGRDRVGPVHWELSLHQHGFEEVEPHVEVIIGEQKPIGKACM